MAEETKQQDNSSVAKKTSKSLLKILLGIVFLVLGISAIAGWWTDLLLVIRGCVGPFLVLSALITFAIAKE